MSNQVQVDLRVGLLDVSLAQLITKDHQLIEFPTLLLPSDVKAGSIVRLTCERDIQGEEDDAVSFEATQNNMLEAFTVNTPKNPVLRVKNTTQTSAVLEWDPIDVASATLHSLALYKNGQRLGNIPNPEKRTTTKLSNLAIDNEYNFHLVLSTSAGVYESETVKVQTHKMTDLSGLTICVGDISSSSITREDLEESVTRMGCKPLQDSVKLDTTHFVATSEAGLQYQRAKDMSIPIVRPEWLKACETERRLVGVRAYYLSADPRTLPPAVRRSRTATVSSSRGDSTSGVSSNNQSPTSGGHTMPIESEPDKVSDKAESETAPDSTENPQSVVGSEPQTSQSSKSSTEPTGESSSQNANELLSEAVPDSEVAAEVPPDSEPEKSKVEGSTDLIEEPTHGESKVEESTQLSEEPTFEESKVEESRQPAEEPAHEECQLEESTQPTEEQASEEPKDLAEPETEQFETGKPTLEDLHVKNSTEADSEGIEPESNELPKQKLDKSKQPEIPEIQINSTSIGPDPTPEHSSASNEPNKTSTSKSKKSKKKNKSK